MLNYCKKSLFVIFLVLFFAGFSVVAMEKEEQKRVPYIPNSLVEISTKAVFEKFIGQSPEETKNDRALLTEEMRALVDCRLNCAVDDSGSTLLHHVKSIEQLERLVASGADINSVNSFGDTPLLWHLKRGHYNKVQFLLKKEYSCDVTHKNRYEVSALDLVETIPDEAVKGIIKKLLIDRGAETSVIQVAGSHLTRWSKMLVTWSGIEWVPQESTKRSFQTYMSLSSLDESLNYLHRLDAVMKKNLLLYVNRPINSVGMTHLHCAKKRSEVQRLLGLHAKSDAKTKSGETPLVTMMQRGYAEAAREFLMNVTPEYCSQTDARGMIPLCYAVLLGNEKVVRALLKKRVNALYVYTIGNRISSPVHLLAESNNQKLVSLLLKKRVVQRMDPEKRFDAMHIALEKDKRSLFKALIPDGCTVDTLYDIDSSNLNFFMYCIKENHKECLTKIFSAHLLSDDCSVVCNLHVKNNRGVTSLMYAAAFSDHKLIQALLEHGASVHDQDHDGNTALHYAVENKCKTADHLLILLKHGANPNVQNNEGDSSLHWAIRMDYYEGVKALLVHGANKRLKNNKQHDPIDDALLQYTSRCASLLGVSRPL